MLLQKLNISMLWFIFWLESFNSLADYLRVSDVILSHKFIENDSKFYIFTASVKSGDDEKRLRAIHIENQKREKREKNFFHAGAK